MKPKQKTTKICPNCGNTHLLRFYSYNMKACTDCYTVIPWYLDEGQFPLHQKQLKMVK